MNGHRRRDSTEIRHDILVSALSGNSKTRIMYASGLNLRQLNLYLAELVASGALEYMRESRLFVVTEKGRAFVKAFQHYREINELLFKQEETLTGFFPTSVRPRIAVPQ